MRAKLKAVNQEESHQKWKEHFKNLLGNSFKVSNKPINKIIYSQLDIKLGHFMVEELDVVLKKIRNKKAAGLNKIPSEIWKTRNLMTYFFNYMSLSKKEKKL